MLCNMQEPNPVAIGMQLVAPQVMKPTKTLHWKRHNGSCSWVQDVVVRALVDTGSTDVDAKIAV